jgi:hypothetical protein
MLELRLHQGDTIKVLYTKEDGTIGECLGYDCTKLGGEPQWTGKAPVPARGVCGVTINGNATPEPMTHKPRFTSDTFKSWTFPSLPVGFGEEPSLLAILPPPPQPGQNNGSTASVRVDCPPIPADYQPDSSFVGTWEVTDGSWIDPDPLPPPAVHMGLIHIYGTPTPEEAEMVLGTTTHYVNFVEFDRTVGYDFVTFHIRRMADFASRAYWTAIRHPEVM